MLQAYLTVNTNRNTSTKNATVRTKQPNPLATNCFVSSSTVSPILQDEVDNSVDDEDPEGCPKDNTDATADQFRVCFAHQALLNPKIFMKASTQL